MNKEYKIDSEIYSEEIIIETISDFKEFADIKYSKNILEITWEDEVEIEEIFGEFIRVLIGSMSISSSFFYGF